MKIGTGHRDYDVLKVILERNKFEVDGPAGFEIKAERVKPKQTDPQRGYYWQSLHKWGEHLGYSARETETILHNEVLCQAYGTRGESVTGTPLPAERSSKQNRERYGHLIDTLLWFASQHDFYIEDPRR